MMGVAEYFGGPRDGQRCQVPLPQLGRREAEAGGIYELVRVYIKGNFRLRFRWTDYASMRVKPSVKKTRPCPNGCLPPMEACDECGG